VEDCIVSPKKSIFEMVTRGVLYHAFGAGVGGVLLEMVEVSVTTSLNSGVGAGFFSPVGLLK
jgi:hypothetical protein